MRALIASKSGELSVEQVPRPDPGRGQVLLRIAACGLCGSDIPRLFLGEGYQYPLVAGHEFAGRIEAIGPGVEDREAGQRVVGFPLIWCGRCPACEKGRFVQCHDYGFLGSRSAGAFAEYVALPAVNTIPVPDEIAWDEAAMTEPAAVALHGLLRLSISLAGESVVVYGAGPVGQITAQWARIMGAEPVVIFDIVEGKLDIARKLGFRYVCNSGSTCPPEEVLKLTQGRGASVCVEAAGMPVTFLWSLESVAREGRVLVLGNPSRDVTIPERLISRVMRHEAAIMGTWNSDYSASGSDDDWRKVLRRIGAGGLRLSDLITHRVGLADAPGVLRKLYEGREMYLKVLIQP